MQIRKIIALLILGISLTACGQNGAFNSSSISTNTTNQKEMTATEVNEELSNLTAYHFDYYGYQSKMIEAEDGTFDYSYNGSASEMVLEKDRLSIDKSRYWLPEQLYDEEYKKAEENGYAEEYASLYDMEGGYVVIEGLDTDYPVSYSRLQDGTYEKHPQGQYDHAVELLMPQMISWSGTTVSENTHIAYGEITVDGVDYKAELEMDLENKLPKSMFLYGDNEETGVSEWNVFGYRDFNAHIDFDDNDRKQAEQNKKITFYPSKLNQNIDRIDYITTEPIDSNIKTLSNWYYIGPVNQDDLQSAYVKTAFSISNNGINPKVCMYADDKVYTYTTEIKDGTAIAYVPVDANKPFVVVEDVSKVENAVQDVGTDAYIDTVESVNDVNLYNNNYHPLGDKKISVDNYYKMSDNTICTFSDWATLSGNNIQHYEGQNGSLSDALKEYADKSWQYRKDLMENFSKRDYTVSIVRGVDKNITDDFRNVITQCSEMVNYMYSKYNVDTYDFNHVDDTDSVVAVSKDRKTVIYMYLDGDNKDILCFDIK